MPEMSNSSYLPWRVSDVAGKATQIANHCFYQIAMGRWLPGSRLPAVRRLEMEWSVNRLTILKAYGLLVDRGLVDHQPNGSYYVAEQGPRRDFARDRIQLEGLYEEVLAKIRSETEMSPLGVLRMLVRIAETELVENPEVAFVECSRSQATDHAREITENLHIPVLPLSLDQIRGKKLRIPPPVRVVFTTSFHIDELSSLQKRDTQVIALPIEISPGLLAEIENQRKEIVFLEPDQDLAQRTIKDAIWMMGMKNPRVEVVPVIDEFLSAHFRSHSGEPPNTLFLIPQKEWESLDPEWRDHASVKPITCVLNEAAWPLVVEALNMPFAAPV